MSTAPFMRCAMSAAIAMRRCRRPGAFRPVRRAHRQADRRADIGRRAGLRGPGRGRHGLSEALAEPRRLARRRRAPYMEPMTRPSDALAWHGTTILSLRKGGLVVVAGDGQVSMGETVVKSNARKVRRLAGGGVIAGFAGTTADAITLFERLEAKLEQYSGQLTRACVELAKDWRTDRYLRRLEAMMAVADKEVSLILSGNGDVLEPEDGIIGIGSGGGYALAAARALVEVDELAAGAIARRAMARAAPLCVYTNDKVTLEKLPA